MKKKTNHSQASQPLLREQCSGCASRDQMIVYLQNQVHAAQQQTQDVLNRFLSFHPQAMESYNRLKMTEAVQTRPDIADGLVSLNRTIPEDDMGIDSMMSQVMAANIGRE